MATRAPMGQQRYENEITAAIAAIATPAGWDVRLRSMTTMRSAFPGARRYPSHLLDKAPLTAAQAIGWLSYPHHGLIHRLDLRLPPAGGLELVTIHDLPPLRFPDEGTMPTSAAAGARRAYGVICPSSFAAKEVTELLGVARIWVIPYGLSRLYSEAPTMDAVELEGLGVVPPFVIHAGGATQRKNLADLALAWEALTPVLPDHSLALCGPLDERRSRLFRHLPRTRLLGAVSPPKVAALMKAAAVVVVPSRYEGFGLPALEGMACGTPVVAVKAGALPEVCADGALLVEPSSEGLARGLKAVLSDPELADRLRRAGAARAASFSWAKAASAHLECYEQAVQQ